MTPCWWTNSDVTSHLLLSWTLIFPSEALWQALEVINRTDCLCAHFIIFLFKYSAMQRVLRQRYCYGSFFIKMGKKPAGQGSHSRFYFLPHLRLFPLYSYILFFLSSRWTHFHIYLLFTNAFIMFISFTSLFIHDNTQVQRKFGNNSAYVLCVWLILKPQVLLVGQISQPCARDRWGPTIIVHNTDIVGLRDNNHILTFIHLNGPKLLIICSWGQTTDPAHQERQLWIWPQCFQSRSNQDRWNNSKIWSFQL